jgi:lipopolysaccharide export system protein LptA
LTVTGDVAVNGGDLTTTAATATLFNSTATTLSIGGAGTSISVGASTGSTTFNHGVVLSDKTLSRVEMLDYFERAVLVSLDKSGGLTLDLSTGQVFQVTLSSNISSITISNIPDNTSTLNSVGFTIIFTADGTARTIVWPTSVKWAGGTAPTMTSTNNKKDIISFLSDSNGTSWYAFVGGQNF